MEGCIAFGLTAALYGEITFENGRVKQRNFHDYPILRMNEMPAVEVHIVETTDKMGGVGEPGVPPVAPALANAIFAATGMRTSAAADPSRRREERLTALASSRGDWQWRTDNTPRSDRMKTLEAIARLIGAADLVIASIKHGKARSATGEKRAPQGG